MSKVPSLAPFMLMKLANDVYGIKAKIVEAVKEKFNNLQLRDLLGSSKI